MRRNILFLWRAPVVQSGHPCQKKPRDLRKKVVPMGGAYLQILRGTRSAIWQTGDQRIDCSLINRHPRAVQEMHESLTNWHYSFLKCKNITPVAQFLTKERGCLDPAHQWYQHWRPRFQVELFEIASDCFQAKRNARMCPADTLSTLIGLLWPNGKDRNLVEAGKATLGKLHRRSNQGGKIGPLKVKIDFIDTFTDFCHFYRLKSSQE